MTFNRLIRFDYIKTVEVCYIPVISLFGNGCIDAVLPVAFVN